MYFPTNSTALADNNTTSSYPPGFNLPASGAKITAFIVIFIFCLIGNCLLIAVVYKNANQRMRTPSNYFILNMACADILLVTYLVPQNIVVTACDLRWLISGVAGEILCRLSFFVGQITVFVSTESLFVIALDRYFLVFYPLKRMITLRTARRIIAAVWIFATVFTGPLFAMSALFEAHSEFLFCIVDFSLKAFVVPYFLFCYTTIIVIPLFIIIVLYIAIAFKINRATPPGNQLPSTQERRERMTHKVLAMLVTIVAALIFFRLPLIISLMACLTGSHDICDKFKVADFTFFAWFFTFTNSSVNPWIYFIFNEQFHHGARLILEKLFPCCFKAGNGVDAVQYSVRQMAGSPQENVEVVHRH